MISEKRFSMSETKNANLRMSMGFDSFINIESGLNSPNNFYYWRYWSSVWWFGENVNKTMPKVTTTTKIQSVFVMLSIQWKLQFNALLRWDWSAFILAHSCSLSRLRNEWYTEFTNWTILKWFDVEAVPRIISHLNKNQENWTSITLVSSPKGIYHCIKWSNFYSRNIAHFSGKWIDKPCFILTYEVYS